MLAYSSSICPTHKYYILTDTQCYNEQANHSSAEPSVVQPDKFGLLQEDYRKPKALCGLGNAPGD